MLYKKPGIPLFIAILFHFTGVLGILFTPYRDWFIANTPLTLILMGILLAASQEKIEKGFVLFFLLAFVTGMVTEMIGINTGILFGYSAGAIASIRKGMAIAKSGILIDSRGGSYRTNTMAVMTDETGAQKSTHISLIGYSRLGYITMPLSIGFEIGKKARLGMDIGGFLSIPISEYHETTYEGTSSEFKPMFPIGRDAGFMANACAKILLSNSISLSTDFRYLHGMADAMGKGQIGQSFSRSFQILGGLTISIGR